MRFKPGFSSRIASMALAGMLLMRGTAQAEDAAESPARALFKEARKLAAEGNYQQACPKFEESLRLEVGIGTQFNLADCWERIGRTASAYALFSGAADAAKAAGQTDREQVLRERAAALEPRLSRLVIEVQAEDPGLLVKRDELPLDAESWGKAIAMDPGSYLISAQASGKERWEKRVEVQSGTPVTTVEIPALKVARAASAAAEAKIAAARVEREAKPQQAPVSAPVADRAQPNYVALALGAFGLASLGVGTSMAVHAHGTNEDAEAICPTSQNCTRQQIKDHGRLTDSARASRSWSYAGFTVGVLSLVGAGTLWHFKIPRRKSSPALQAAPLVDLHGNVGAALSGSF